MRIFQPTVTGSNTTTGSLHISGPVYFYTLENISIPHILVYNTESGQVNYALSTALETSPFPFTGSAGITGSIVLTGSMFTNGAISASLGPNTVGFYGTASWAQNVLTASFITAAGVFGPFGSSSVLSASYASSSNNALTASYLLNPYPIDVTGSSLYSIDPVAGVPSNPAISNSIFFGNQAGYNSTNAYNSNFLGEFAGKNAVNSYNSNFLGPQAGNSAFSAYNSNFLGSQSGYDANNALQSNFLGLQAGYQATNANNSNFLGNLAGNNATNAYNSNFLGNLAGYNATNANQSNFFTFGAGTSATNANNSNFLGKDAGFYATNASHSNFIGYRAGVQQNKAAYSTLIGYQVGDIANSIGPNNIIIGTNITLDVNRQDSINIGGIIFGTGSYNDFTPRSATFYPYSGSINGRIGINIVYPSYSFHASGSISFPSLINQSQPNIVVIDTASGQLFYLPTSSVGGGSGVTINNNNNNYLITATGTSNTLDGEANLQFDGSTLTVIGNILANSITGSFTGSLTGSLYGTASWAESASFALTAAAAPEDTWIQYNKEGLFSATGSFRFIYTSQSFQQGDQVTASGNYSHAEGVGTIAFGVGSHAEGFLTVAQYTASHAEGSGSIANSNYAHAEGISTVANGFGSHTEGVAVQAAGTGSHAEGFKTIAGGPYSHAEGYDTYAPGNYSHAEGNSTEASGVGSHAEGLQTRATDYGHSEGENTYATNFSHTEGELTTASGGWSHAEGLGSNASNQRYTHAEGYYTRAGVKGFSGKAISYSTIEIYDQGDLTSEFFSNQLVIQDYGVYNYSTTNYTNPTFSIQLDSNLQYAFEQGGFSGVGPSPVAVIDTQNLFSPLANNIGLGYASHTEGYLTTSSNNHSHAEGRQTIAYGVGSHTEGLKTIALGNYSHAEGYQTTSSGNYSHAEGSGSISLGLYSHAEGHYTTALGQGSHSEGHYTFASGAYSHAEGLNTIAKGNYQHTQGQYNITSSFPSAFIIGNGTSNADRSNLLFASSSNVEISGSLYVTSSLFSQGPLISEGSRVRKYREITLTDSDVIGSPPAVEIDDDIILITDNTTAIPLAGDGTLSITNFLANSPAGRCIEIVKIVNGDAGVILVVPAGMGGTNLMLNKVSMANSTKAVCNNVGESITLMAMGLAKTGSAWGNGW